MIETVSDTLTLDRTPRLSFPGITGILEIVAQEPRIHALTEIDLGRVRAFHGLNKMESVISWNERYMRLMAAGHVPLDAFALQQIWGMWQKKDKIFPPQAHFWHNRPGKTRTFTFDGTRFMGGTRGPFVLAIWMEDGDAWIDKWYISQSVPAHRESVVLVA